MYRIARGTTRGEVTNEMLRTARYGPRASEIKLYIVGLEIHNERVTFDQRHAPLQCFGVSHPFLSSFEGLAWNTSDRITSLHESNEGNC